MPEINISPRILKEMATHISPRLGIIFRESYDTGEVPNIWKTAFVCPIYKKRKKSEAINSRPVADMHCLQTDGAHCDQQYMCHVDQHSILHPL